MERRTVIVISGEEHRHVRVTTDGNDEATCLADAEFVEKVFRPFGHKDHYIRVPPGAVSQKDFETDETLHRGFARFNLAPVLEGE